MPVISHDVCYEGIDHSSYKPSLSRVTASHISFGNWVDPSMSVSALHFRAFTHAILSGLQICYGYDKIKYIVSRIGYHLAK